MLKKLSIFLILVIFCANFLLFCTDTSNPSEDIPIRVIRLSPKTIILNCLQTNVIAISSIEGLIVIDTHRSPGLMSAIKNEIRNEFKRDDYLYIINTHGHWDHCSGNQVFSGITIIGHQFCPTYMQNFPANSVKNLLYAKKSLTKTKENLATLDNHVPEYRALFNKMKAEEMLLSDLKNGYKLTPPSKLFLDSLTIRLADMTIRLVYCGKSHTNNDIFIYIPEEKFVATGDIFTSSSHFGFSLNQMADLDRLVETINRLVMKNINIEFVIPAHSEILTRADLLSLRDRLVDKLSEFKNIKSAARLLEKFIENHGIALALKKLEKATIDNYNLNFSEKEFDILGYRLRGMGKITEAIEVLKLNIKNYPNSANAYDSLAETYLSQCDYDSAIQYYTKSLKLYPLNKNASDLISEINDIKDKIK